MCREWDHPPGPASCLFCTRADIRGAYSPAHLGERVEAWGPWEPAEAADATA